MQYEKTFTLKYFRIRPYRLIQIIAGVLTLVMLANATPPASANLQGREVVLPEGADFTVVTIEEIDGKHATEGDPITFKVEEDVRVNGQVVIYRGTTAKGSIVNLEKSKRMGRGGKIAIRVESTTAVDGQKIKLRASKNQQGGDKTTSVIALSLLITPLFLFKRGKNAKIKEGTRITVYTDEAKSIQVKEKE